MGIPVSSITSVFKMITFDCLFLLTIRQSSSFCLQGEQLENG
jgi:hypothetical protein